MRIRHLRALIVLPMLALALTARAAPPRDPEIERKIDELLGRMTLDEKLGQLEQIGVDPKKAVPDDEQRALARQGKVGSFLNVRGARKVNETQRIAVEESRLKIPLLLGFDVIHGYRTIFPTPLGEASSWDPALAERSARIAAEEAAAAGVRWTFAPMVDIARDPRWSRISEGSGEDPYLGAAFARARVRGFQGTDYGAPGRVLACAKHWAAYGAAEGGRDYNSVDISERTLREIYFPPFRAALDAGVGSFMSAFNDLNGIPATANPFLLTDVLRREWKFDGLAVSDYEAVAQLIPHGIAADGREAARRALAAGIDMEMQSRLFLQFGPQLVKDGSLAESVIDEAVRQVLRVKFRAKLFDRPYADEDREQSVLLSRANLDAAREIAARSMVLLKNDQKTLPLSAQQRAIAVIGPLADDRGALIGHWRGDGREDDVVTVLAALKARFARRDDVRMAHAKGCEIEGDSTAGFAAAERAATEADIAIVVVGEAAEMEGEAACRSEIGLPGRQLELVKAVQATGTPTVVVLINARPLAIPWIAEHVPAIVEAWMAGTQGGPAVVDVLFGDVNPGGKLPVTFPRAVGQIPIYYNHRKTGRPADEKNKYTSKYIDLPSTPLFPFGHGLSYTEFRLENLRLSGSRIARDGHLTASVDVRNTGERAGDEVVQLYVSDPAASVDRPVRQLRGFSRITLRPGESRTVPFELGPDDLGFYDREMKFAVEPGKFKVHAGTSCVGGLEAEFEVSER